jgi:hypothetical protein
MAVLAGTTKGLDHLISFRSATRPLVMQRRTDGGIVTVPIPDHAEIRIGTLQAIIRQSGIPRSAFES